MTIDTQTSNDRAQLVTRSFALRRHGYSLLEMLAVVTILGLLAAIGATRISPGLKGNLAAGSDSFQILMALRQARTAAIATGDNHRLRMLASSGTITGFQIERDGGSTTIVEGPHTLSSDTTITQVGGDATFNFQGEATVAPVITFAGPDRTERITVISATGWGLLQQF
ncbi:prepilin-type N-terminal cleavage/methylation domain-containing protein [Bremerella sp. JC817]|uniref:pilus assembly FimT family protein n=1 Tax=Bremerella sp. JC817 TaxID=3231756 RepID=UPI00345A82C3